MCTFRNQNTSSACRVSRWVLGLCGLLAIVLLRMEHASSDDTAPSSGLKTSQFEVSQPFLGEPPRPHPPERPPLFDYSNSPEENQAQEHGSSIYIPHDSEAHELSVEPGSKPLLPADAPAWIGALPDTAGEVHRLHVGGLIAETESEASALLDEALVAALTNYADQTVLQRSGASAALHRKMTSDFIWKNLIDDPQGYVVRLNTSGIPMFQKWVTVSITPQQRDMIRDWDREATQRKRLAPVSVGMLGLLGGVGLLHLIFKGRKPRP